MIKTNTVLNALGVLLMGLLCFIGKGMWEDVASLKATSINTSAQVLSIVKTIDDHESRIRMNERDIISLQQQREDRTARPPKLNDKP